MAYTVTITYNGVTEPEVRFADPIASMFEPTGSYIDSAVYTEGCPVGAEEADKKYGKSIYATNVDGWGEIAVKEPYASTSIPFPSPLAQFKLAIVSDEKDEAGNPFVTFTVEDYKEAFYYKQIGHDLADQGFTVEVKN